MAIIAKDCAKTKAIIIAVKILGALEGFLPKAVILEKVPAAKTAQGPRMHKQKIITKARLRLIYLLQYVLLTLSLTLVYNNIYLSSTIIVTLF